MTILDATTQHELIDLLSQLFTREQERRPLLALALGEEEPALARIECSGAVEPFILRMAAELARAGETQPGKQALWKLLEIARPRLSAERQARIDALEPIVNQSVARAQPAARRRPGVAPLHLRVFLASPGDVADERALALQVLDRLPYDPLLRGQVHIEAVAWDQPGGGVPMLATLTPQDAIAASLPKPSQCDIVVVILWSRMGTPLPADYRKPDGAAYLSGTEWEYLDALLNQQDGRPAILVYRRTEEPELKQSDPQFDEKRRQWLQVEAFFGAFRYSDGSIRRGCNAYAAPEDFRQQLDLHLRVILRPLLEKRGAVEMRPTEHAAPVAAPPLWPGSPFPGLRAFTPDDALVFFGRGRETDELLHRLADASTRFLVVVGGSGSGKSSLVAAGLLPRLKNNAIDGSKDWLLPHVLSIAAGTRKQWTGLRFTPGELGDNPFLALAAKLAPLVPDDATTPRGVAEQLEADAEALAQLAEAALQGRPPWAEILIFIDQLEELFSIVAKCYRGPFIDLLAAAARAPRVRTVATVRVDFYQRCLEWPKLTEILRGASFPLAAPGLVALLEMVTGPAGRAGLAFEEGLSARILEDTGTDPGALALLAFAMHELYETRAPHGRLTHSAYDTFGGVRGAISRRAEDTFARLPVSTQSLLGSVFRELVDVDERGVTTRRRVRRELLASSAEGGALADAFTDARLLVTDQGPDGAAVVEVAHEALLQEWQRMANWVRDRAGDLRLWRQAEAAAAEWHRSGRHTSHLWPHERLVLVQEAQERLGVSRTSLSEPAQSFLRPEAERLLEELAYRTTHYRRAEIGDRLDHIGDPRPGVGLRPDGLPHFVWCEVPGGTVRLEGYADLQAKVAPFLIAKYSVTYRQYRRFLNDPQGYRNERWWEGLKHEPEPGEQYRPTGNCPADNVSWYDAIAYCRWLSARLDHEVRLPAEWEWQQAASGGHADYEYPWGHDWVEGRANTAEARLSRTTAVGMYLHDASAQGALDLVGNVWEWCLNTYQLSTNVRDSGPRVLRGGSWDRDRDYCRCAFRFRNNPEHRFSYFGFRVCCGGFADAPLAQWSLEAYEEMARQGRMIY